MKKSGEIKSQIDFYAHDTGATSLGMRFVLRNRQCKSVRLIIEHSYFTHKKKKMNSNWILARQPFNLDTGQLQEM